MKPVLKLLFFLLMTPMALRASVPDSLMEAKGKLTEYVKEAQQLTMLIVAPSDMQVYSTDLNILQKKMSMLEQRWPQILENEELTRLYRKYQHCMDGLQPKMEAYTRRLLQDSLHREMHRLGPQMDTLLAQSTRFADKKMADSVRSVKQRANDIWVQVAALRERYASILNSDQELKESISHVEYVKSQIMALSENEPTKPRDILLVVGVVVAALSMIGGTIGGIVRSRRFRKSDENCFEL